MLSWIGRHQTVVDRLPTVQRYPRGGKLAVLTPARRAVLEAAWPMIEPRARSREGITLDWIASRYEIPATVVLEFLREKGLTKAGTCTYRFPPTWQDKRDPGRWVACG